MEMEKVRALGDQELMAASRAAAEQLFRLRFQKSLGNQEGLKKLRTLKIEIARTKTEVRARAIAAEKAAHPIVVQAAPAASKRTERKKARQG